MLENLTPICDAVHLPVQSRKDPNGDEAQWGRSSRAFGPRDRRDLGTPPAPCQMMVFSNFGLLYPAVRGSGLANATSAAKPRLRSLLYCPPSMSASVLLKTPWQNSFMPPLLLFWCPLCDLARRVLVRSQTRRHCLRQRAPATGSILTFPELRSSFPTPSHLRFLSLA